MIGIKFMTTIGNHLSLHHNHLKLNHRLHKANKRQWLHNNTIWKWIRDMLASYRVNTIWTKKLLLNRWRSGRCSRGRRCMIKGMKTLKKLRCKVLTAGVTIAYLLTHTSTLSLNHRNHRSLQRPLGNQLNPNLMLRPLQNPPLLPSQRVSQLLSHNLRLKNQLQLLQLSLQEIQNLLQITIPTITERKHLLS